MHQSAGWLRVEILQCSFSVELGVPLFCLGFVVYASPDTLSGIPVGHRWWLLGCMKCRVFFLCFQLADGVGHVLFQTVKGVQKQFNRAATKVRDRVCLGLSVSSGLCICLYICLSVTLGLSICLFRSVYLFLYMCICLSLPVIFLLCFTSVFTRLDWVLQLCNCVW